MFWQRDTLPALTSAPAHIPLVEGTPAQGEPQWRLHEDGLLEPCYPVLDLYLVSEIERFCDRDEADGHYRLTEQTLRRALEQGMELNAILRFLRHYCDGGIPPSLLIRMKLWGGGYDNLQALRVEHAPLLRLPESVLRDIQADGELAPLLGQEVEDHSRLVRVEPEKLEQVVELLKERGFMVE